MCLDKVWKREGTVFRGLKMRWLVIAPKKKTFEAGGEDDTALSLGDVGDIRISAPGGDYLLFQQMSQTMHGFSPPFSQSSPPMLSRHLCALLGCTAGDRTIPFRDKPTKLGQALLSLTPLHLASKSGVCPNTGYCKRSKHYPSFLSSSLIGSITDHLHARLSTGLHWLFLSSPSRLSSFAELPLFFPLEFFFIQGMFCYIRFKKKVHLRLPRPY
jgi:hypothetical protein